MNTSKATLAVANCARGDFKSLVLDININEPVLLAVQKAVDASGYNPMYASEHFYGQYLNEMAAIAEELQEILNDINSKLTKDGYVVEPEVNSKSSFKAFVEDAPVGSLKAYQVFGQEFIQKGDSAVGFDHQGKYFIISISKESEGRFYPTNKPWLTVEIYERGNSKHVRIHSTIHVDKVTDVLHSYSTGWSDEEILKDSDLYKYLSIFN